MVHMGNDKDIKISIRGPPCHYVSVSLTTFVPSFITRLRKTCPSFPIQHWLGNNCPTFWQFFFISMVLRVAYGSGIVSLIPFLSLIVLSSGFHRSGFHLWFIAVLLCNVILLFSYFMLFCAIFCTVLVIVLYLAFIAKLLLWHVFLINLFALPIYSLYWRPLFQVSFCSMAYSDFHRTFNWLCFISEYYLGINLYIFLTSPLLPLSSIRLMMQIFVILQLHTNCLAPAQCWKGCHTTRQNYILFAFG